MRLHQSDIQTAHLNQGIVGTAFNNLATIENHNVIHMPHHCGPMCNENGCLFPMIKVSRASCTTLLDSDTIAELASSSNKMGAFFQHHSSNGDSLLLPRSQIDSSHTNVGVITMR